MIPMADLACSDLCLGSRIVERDVEIWSVGSGFWFWRQDQQEGSFFSRRTLIYLYDPIVTRGGARSTY